MRKDHNLDIKLKLYDGRVPACGCFCGGCPTYTRDRNPCPGAAINIKRCEGCKKFHLCCKERGITHCYQCDEFPCRGLKTFTKSWLKYGQNFIENQIYIRDNGESGFLKHYNSKITGMKKVLDEKDYK